MRTLIGCRPGVSNGRTKCSVRVSGNNVRLGPLTVWAYVECEWGSNGVFREGRGGIQVCMVHLQSLLSASMGHHRVQCQGALGVSYI